MVYTSYKLNVIVQESQKSSLDIFSNIMKDESIQKANLKAEVHTMVNRTNHLRDLSNILNASIFMLALFMYLSIQKKNIQLKS